MTIYYIYMLALCTQLFELTFCCLALCARGRDKPILYLFFFPANCFFNLFLNNFLKIYLHILLLVEFRGLVSEYWYSRIQTMVSPHKHRKLFFFIAYRKLILNYAKAFITLYPWIKSSLSPRVLLGLVLNLLEE